MRLRLGSSKLVSTWIIATLLVSIAAVFEGGTIAGWAALAPSRIWHGEVWRLATWVFVELGPLGLILTCATIYKFGEDLTPRWGDRRLRQYAIEVLGGTAVATALLALISPDIWRLHHVGGWAVGNALVIAWARQYPERTLILYGLLRLHGRDLIAVTVAINCVFAIFVGPFAMAPDLLACAGAYWYPAARLARR
jgi:membrane associated rhomboid family serine protease